MVHGHKNSIWFCFSSNLSVFPAGYHRTSQGCDDEPSCFGEQRVPDWTVHELQWGEMRHNAVCSKLGTCPYNTVFASRVYVKNECLSYCFLLTTVLPLLRQLVVFFFKDIFSRFPLASYVFLPLARSSLISMAQIICFPAFSSHRLPVYLRNSITMLFLTFSARHSIIC